MREVIITLKGLICEAQLCDGRRNVLAEARIELNGPTNWYELLAKVGDELKLLEHAPPGLVTEGDGDTEVLSAQCAVPWQVMQGGFGIPWWGWGFLMPDLPQRGRGAEGLESCCGFRDEAAAVKAANFLRHNLNLISGELPNGVFEVFNIAQSYAFLDLHGQVHASFPTIHEARGCAAKLEAVQMNKTAA